MGESRTPKAGPPGDGTPSPGFGLGALAERCSPESAKRVERPDWASGHTRRRGRASGGYPFARARSGQRIELDAWIHPVRKRARYRGNGWRVADKRRGLRSGDVPGTDAAGHAFRVIQVTLPRERAPPPWEACPCQPLTRASPMGGAPVTTAHASLPHGRRARNNRSREPPPWESRPLPWVADTDTG